MATTGYSANDVDVRRRIVELPDSPSNNINGISTQQAPLQQQEDDLKKTVVINAKKTEVCFYCWHSFITVFCSQDQYNKKSNGNCIRDGLNKLIHSNRMFYYNMNIYGHPCFLQLLPYLPECTRLDYLTLSLGMKHSK